MLTLDSLGNIFTDSLRSAKRDVMISKDLYWYFLDVLPPREMGRGYFIFQEGDGARIRFAECGEEYYAELLRDSLVCSDWQVHINARRSVGCSFVITDFAIQSEEKVDPTVLTLLSGINGKEFETIHDIESYLGLKFR